MIEDAQKQVRRAGRTIADETLLLFASTAMLTTEIFLKENKDWEDRAAADKTWSECKAAYKRAHAKARVKAQATDGSVKLGAANAATRMGTKNTTRKMETNYGVNEGA